MLLSFVDVFIDQDHVVDSLGINKKITQHGMTVFEMERYITKNYPELKFWYKFNSSISELSQLINQFKYPVGVEWQGIFDYPDDDDDEPIDDYEDDDPGHYSVITSIDLHQNLITIADPDHHYAKKDRKFTILQFERRWWDLNEVIDPKTKKHTQSDEYHCLFLVTPLSVRPPASINFFHQ